jgi:membrane-associated phospholipid phosphatase
MNYNPVVLMKSKLFDSKPWALWRPVWEQRKSRARFTSALGLFFLLFMALPYGLVNRVSSGIGWTAFDPSLSLDQAIPYVPILNVAYFSLYIYYVLIPLFASNEMQKKCSIIFSQRLFIITIPVFIIFLLLPVEVDLRGEVVGEDVLTSALTLIHNFDKAFNAWPSLHVVHSLCVVLSVPLIFRISRFTLSSLWIGWALLTISTMTTQQHYAFDVITGIVFALFAHYQFIKPALINCLENKYDEVFEGLQANKVDTS